MPEIPQEAVEALVPLQEAVRRVLIDARLGSDVDELSARVAVAVAVELGGRVEAAAPILAAQERADERRKVAAEYEDLLGSIWLYIGWRDVSRSLTTEQKELFADAVEASDRRRCEEDTDEPVTVDRWWRDDAPTRQIGQAL